MGLSGIMDAREAVHCPSVAFTCSNVARSDGRVWWQYRKGSLRISFYPTSRINHEPGARYYILG